VLVVGGNRSIVASVAAAGRFDFRRWDSPAVLSVLCGARVALVSAYFLRSSAETGLAVVAEATARGVALGLASPSAIDSEAWPALRVLFRTARVVFGN
jgi:hypothetical protein